LSAVETIVVILFAVAALALLLPNRRSGNVNPRPTFDRPPAPPGPPVVRRQHVPCADAWLPEPSWIPPCPHTPIPQAVSCGGLVSAAQSKRIVMKEWKFDLKQVVKITESSEQGTIIGRAEYSTTPLDSYLIRGTGKAVETWWTADALEAA
jgi:hypothetical protein